MPFSVEHFQTPSGDPVSEEFADAKQALDFAEKRGSGVTITDPDGQHLHVSDFRIAVGNGKYGPA